MLKKKEVIYLMGECGLFNVFNLIRIVAIFNKYEFKNMEVIWIVGQGILSVITSVLFCYLAWKSLRICRHEEMIIEKIERYFFVL